MPFSTDISNTPVFCEPQEKRDYMDIDLDEAAYESSFEPSDDLELPEPHFDLPSLR